MTLALLGWSVVHALWIGTAIGGATAFALGLIGDHRPELRYRLAATSLVLMIVAPLVMALATVDLFTPLTRRQLTGMVEATIGLPALVEWRARVVRTGAVLWLAGVVVQVIHIGRECRRLRRLRHVGLADAGQPARELVVTLAAELGVRTPVALLRSSEAAVPMVFGWRRPQLLLPAHAGARLAADQLRAVLAHELAHVRRRDYLANLLQVGAETLLWFHPAARWVSRRLRMEREYCCDDVAVSVGTDAVEYAHALAALEEARGDCRLVVAAAAGTLLDRVQRIVGQPRPVLTPGRGALALIAALTVASVIGALTLVVPPGMPLDARLRSRSPQPPVAGVPTSTERSLPRSSQP